MAARRHVNTKNELFGDVAAILNSIILISYQGMLKEQIQFNLPPKHPITAV